MAFSEKLYRKAPYFIKVVLLNVKSFLNKRKRYTPQYHQFLAHYKGLWLAPIDEIKTYQNDELSKLLLECRAHVPYYQTIFETLEISEKECASNPFGVLKQLPLLTKEDRKNKVEDIVNQHPDRPLVEIGYTSGTSGSPTEIHFDSETLARGFALWSRFHHTIGITGDERMVRFSGRIIVDPSAKKPPFWIYSRIDKQLYMSAYHLTTTNCAAYIKKLNTYKPEFLDGYPSALYVLANYVLSQNTTLNFVPKAIAVTAETLYSYQRIAIEKAFGCKVYNQYASSEGSPLITECTSGNLHVNLDSGIFEFLDAENNPAAPGNIAKMVVSSFRNLKTPLLRYNINDSVLLPKKQVLCDCGCKMPLVIKIVGREDDLLWTPEKGYVGRMDTAYKGITGIVKSQLIQQSPEKLVVNNIVDHTYTAAIEAKLIQNLNERLGKDIHIVVHSVDEIPLSANGKFDAVKREFEIPKM